MGETMAKYLEFMNDFQEKTEKLYESMHQLTIQMNTLSNQLEANIKTQERERTKVDEIEKDVRYHSIKISHLEESKVLERLRAVESQTSEQSTVNKILALLGTVGVTAMITEIFRIVGK